jgi:hypothetical protein
MDDADPAGTSLCTSWPSSSRAGLIAYWICDQMINEELLRHRILITPKSGAHFSRVENGVPKRMSRFGTACLRPGFFSPIVTQDVTLTDVTSFSLRFLFSKLYKTIAGTFQL